MLWSESTSQDVTFIHNMSTDDDRRTDPSLQGEPDASTIIERLKDAIAIRTDAELATLLGCLPSTVSNWRSRNTVPLGRLRRLCKERGVPIDYLLSGRLGLDKEGLPLLDSKQVSHLFRLLDRYGFIRLPETTDDFDPATRAAAEFLVLQRGMATALKSERKVPPTRRGKKGPQ